MKDLMYALDTLIAASNVLAEDTGIDEIYVHPKIYAQMLRHGIGEQIRDRHYNLKRIEYKRVDIKEGRPSLPSQMRY